MRRASELEGLETKRGPRGPQYPIERRARKWYTTRLTVDQPREKLKHTRVALAAALVESQHFGLVVIESSEHRLAQFLASVHGFSDLLAQAIGSRSCEKSRGKAG